MTAEAHVHHSLERVCECAFAFAQLSLLNVSVNYWQRDLLSLYFKYILWKT
eukprot:m.167092 g.167092  ORF g.167092 m.167092 type:complete len:51 (-) comp13461_c0_seq3:1740-1892(-)